MMKTMSSFFGLTLLAAAMIGCSASVETGGDPFLDGKAKPNEFFDKRATISGPSVEGAWKSDCNYDPLSRSYRTFEIIFKGSQVKRTEQAFSDSSCATSVKKNTYSGKFRFIAKFAQDTYVVEYAFDIGKGARTFPQENLRKDANAIYIGNFVVGAGIPGREMGVLVNEPLHAVDSKTGDSKTPGRQPVDGAFAESYSEAKFAACDLQGSVYILDLSKLNLSSYDAKTDIKIGSPSCDGSVKWYTSHYTAAVTQRDGYPQITIGGSVSGTINAGASGSGLLIGGSYPSRIYSVIGGNSGDCRFLKTASIKALPFYCN